jgi:NADH-quinone oxidoreductase subunit C
VTENSDTADVVPAGTETLEVLDTGRGAFGVEGSPDVSGYGGLVRTTYAPAAATRPYGRWYDDAVDTLAEVLGDTFGPAVSKVVVAHDQLTLVVQREHLPVVMRTLRDHPGLRFEVCLGANGVHWPQDTGQELHVHYPMLSMTHNRRLSIEVTCPEDDPHIPSVVDIYPGNNWHERETYDFFGVVFDGHPGLTRIEMPDDWVGHPQRKDYPLGGIPVEYKGASIPPPDDRREYK